MTSDHNLKIMVSYFFITEVSELALEIITASQKMTLYAVVRIVIVYNDDKLSGKFLGGSERHGTDTSV